MANTTVSLNHEGAVYSDGKDAIVVTRMVADLPGGASLDVTGFTAPYIRKGHIIIKETETGKYKPLGVTEEGAYVTLPEKHEYFGVAGDTVLTARPLVGIITAGQINAAASPYPVTSAIAEGLPRIEFLYRKAEATTEPGA